MQLPEVRPIRDIIELALYSAGVLNLDGSRRRQVSLMLCSLPDNGKTTWIMDPFADNERLHTFTMATRIGIAKYLFTARRYEKLDHFLIPDMTAPLAGERAVAEAFQGFLMGLIYDGIRDMHTFNLPNLMLSHPVVVGLIAGVTPATVNKRKEQWADSGFLRRFMPVSYNYTAEQDDGIKTLIAQGRNAKPHTINLNSKLWGTIIHMDDKFAPPLVDFTMHIVTGLGVSEGKIKGNTFVEQMRTLVLAHALRRGSAEVEREDLEAIVRLSRFMNYDGNTVDNLPYGFDPYQTKRHSSEQ